jgi:hypothetical protein
LIWLESITSLLAPILLEIPIMTDFGRQACLNGRHFETLAQAIARKDPKNTQAIISFEPVAVTGEAAPSDLFHDEIEKLRASAEAYLARARQKPEINEREAAEFIGAALDLEDRARDYIDSGEPAHAVLVIALKKFSVAHQSLRDAVSEALTGQSEKR